MKHIKSVIILTTTLLPLALLQGPPEDATLDFKGLARKYGHKSQDYNLTTEDGYILMLFRIPGNNTKPVLVMHGFLDSSDSFILRGRKSLAAALSDKGYDVWVGNTRGNKYSRRHKWLDPDMDKEFWNFSFHEMAVIDVRVFIDFILQENNVKSVSVIGHSQGNALFYTLGSTIPEYNDKINIAIALGPIAYLNEDNFQVPLNLAFSLGPLLNLYLLAVDGEEIFGENSLIVQFRNYVCTQRGVGYALCAGGIFAPLGGEDFKELEPEFFLTVMGHYPTSTSRKDAQHLLQIAKRKAFAHFDYGPEKNLEIYKSKTSPVYDLSKVTMKVALFVGKNDKVTPMRNVELLRDELPNVVSYHVMEREKFNHVDHIWGKNMDKYLFPYIFKLLAKYT